jgi:MFS family permease
MLYLFAGVFGFAYGGLVTVESPIIAEQFGLSSHGVIFGMIHSISTTGGAFGPVLAGRIFDISGNYQLAFLIYAVVTVIGLIVASLVTPAARQGGTNG